MPITLEQLRNQIANRRAALPGVQRCAVCDIALQETVTGNRKVGDGHVCSDCYFNILSEEIDQHPILMPRTPRGT